MITMRSMYVCRLSQIGRLTNQGIISTYRIPIISERNGLLSVGFSVRFASQDGSKVEHTLRMIKEDIQKQHDEAKRLKLVPASDDIVKKLTLKEKVIHELKHYYHGFRLLALETKLSAKYVWQVLKGKTLSRRERQQLVRTVSDLFRLVPFSIFIIVPFMELALPIFIKLFPNMLPSTFQESSKEEEKLRKQVKVKVEMAKFLQDTIEEIALERKSKPVANTDSKALEFARFIKKVRTEGGYVSNQELFKFSKLFEDELTLDNLSMSQLRSLCRLMGIQPLGSPEILRFQLNMKLRELKADDKQIAAEGGVEALNAIDLQQACRARGMRAVGLSEDRLRDQLKQWLELSLNDKVPPSLLLLSRALYLPEDITFADRLKALVQNLPEGIAEQTRQKLTEIEGGQVDHKARIELIKQIEEAIAKEKMLVKEKERLEEQQKQLQREAEEAKLEEVIGASVETASIVQEKEKIELKTEDKLPSGVSVDADVDSFATIGNELAAVKKVKDLKDDVKVDPTDLSSIEQILVGGPIKEAKNDIIGLKEKVIEHTEDLIEINSLDEAFSETKVARRLRSKLNSMIENVDSLVDKLEEEKRNISETIADPAVPESSKLKQERQVRIQDLIDNLKKLRADSPDDKGERIEHLLKIIDADKDGLIDAALLLEVIALTEKHSDVQLSPKQMAEMIEMLKKEDQAEAAERALTDAQFDAPIQPQFPQLEEQAKKPQGPLSVPDVDPSITKTLNSKKNSNVNENKKPEKL